MLGLPQEWTNLSPDVLVLDVSMGGLGGFEVAGNLWVRGARAQVVFLTVYEDSEFVTRAFAAGDFSYVFNSCIATELVPAIDKACTGGMFVSSARMFQVILATFSWCPKDLRAGGAIRFVRSNVVAARAKYLAAAENVRSVFRCVS